MQLTHERLIQVLSYDSDLGTFTRNGRLVGIIGKNGYGQIKIDGVKYQAHRLAWFYVHGEWPSGVIDHQRHRGNDLENLRDVPLFINSQNQRHAHRNSSSGSLGVSWWHEKKKWRADIKVSGKAKYLGSFSEKADAVEAYLRAKREFHPGCTL